MERVVNKVLDILKTEQARLAERTITPGFICINVILRSGKETNTTPTMFTVLQDMSHCMKCFENVYFFMCISIKITERFSCVCKCAAQSARDFYGNCAVPESQL